MIRDRIDYTVQNLLIAKYEHMMTGILFFKSLCLREDMFHILTSINNAKSEEEYLEYIKKFITYTKLLAPEVIELYDITQKYVAYRKLLGYDREFNSYTLIEKKRELEEYCEQFI